MAAVRASTRVSIAWKGAEPFEDTDTIVLTIHDYSLDLRVFIDGPRKGDIDWSTVAFVRQVEGSTAANPRLRWDHLIDSRPPTDMADEGVFRTLPDGDVMESGTMWNPKTNAYEAYEEHWRRYPSEPGAPYLVLEACDEQNLPGGRTFVGRVGNRALGLALSSDGVYSAWREELSGDEWRRTFDSPPAVAQAQRVPSLPITTPTEWHKEGTVQWAGLFWIVRHVGTL